MIKAVLLDLDNTLLHNPDRRFASEILRLLEEHFQARLGIKGASQAFRQGIRLVCQPSDQYTSNSDKLLDSLSRQLSLRREVAASALDAFYGGSYREAAALTQPVAGSRRLIRCLLDQGLLVAIATNPLYPEAAVQQRLAWAGIADLAPELAFISHSGATHFAKPDPAYYAEVIARVGVEPDEALMVGDSEKNDIQPARALGIRTWHVDAVDRLSPLLEHVHQPGWRDAYLPSPLSPDALLPQFRGNLAALYGLLAEVKAHQWRQRPQPEEWSILQILCHLWTAETQVHQQRLRAILNEDNPFLAAGAPPGPDIPHCHDDGYEIMRRFKICRYQTIALLSGLAAADWARPARHSIFGLTNLLEMAQFTAQHDRLHISQLCQTLGKCDE